MTGKKLLFFNNKGLTFVELIIVVTIIGLLFLAAVTVISPFERLQEARDNQREMHLKAIQQAVSEKTYQDNWDCDSLPSEKKLISSKETSEVDALEFDGADDYVEMLNDGSIDLTTSLTIGAWFKSGEDSSDVRRITSSPGNANSLFLKYGDIYFAYYDSDGSHYVKSDNKFVDNKFHYAVATWDKSSGVLRLYIDGNEVDNKTGLAKDNAYPTSDWGIGAAEGGGSQFFNGSIDDVRIYNRALNSTEISNLYQRYQVSNEGLVGHWKFNEGEGITVNDSSGNDNHGSIEGASWIKHDIEASELNALDFDGVNDYIDVGGKSVFNFVQNTLDFTISAWIKLDDLDSRQIIFGNSASTTSKGFVFMWEIYGDGYGDHALRFSGVRGDTGNQMITCHSEDNTITDNSWYHVLVINTGAESNVKFYVDGELKETTYRSEFDGTLSEGDATSSYRIGATDTDSLPFNGSIDDVQIYNRALTEQEINNLYLKQDVEEGLVGHWKFDEGTGTTANDSSGNNNHGTIEGASWMKYITSFKHELYSCIFPEFLSRTFYDPQIGEFNSLTDYFTGYVIFQDNDKINLEALNGETKNIEI